MHFLLCFFEPVFFALLQCANIKCCFRLSRLLANWDSYRGFVQKYFTGVVFGWTGPFVVEFFTDLLICGFLSAVFFPVVFETR